MAFSQLFGLTYLPIGLAGVHYHAITGDLDSSAEERVQRLWLEWGVFRYFRFRLDDPVPANNALTVTVRINEVDTAMAFTLNTGDQEAIAPGPLEILALDRVDLKMTVTGAGVGIGIGRWNIEFAPMTGSKSVYGHTQTDGNALSPIYYSAFAGFSNAGGHNAVEPCVSVSPCDGTITHLGVIIEGAQIIGSLADSHQWLLVKSTDNGTTWIDQDGTGGTPDTRVTLPHLGSHYHYSTFTLSVSAGDLFYVRYDNLRAVPAFAINVYGGISLVFDPATDGEFIVPGLTVDDLNPVATEYSPGAGANGDVSIAPDGALAGVSTITLSKFRLFLENAPGATKQYQFDFTTGGSTSPVSNGPTLTMTGTDKADIDPDHQIVVSSASQQFTLREVPTNMPTAGVMTWGLVGKAGIQTVQPPGSDVAIGSIGPYAWIEWPRRVP